MNRICSYGYRQKKIPLLSILFLLFNFYAAAFAQKSSDNFENNKSPKIVFTNLTVFGEPVKVGPNEPLKQHISQAQKIELSYQQYAFSISFTTQNYKGLEKIVYSYLLIGFDKGWQNAGENNSIRYTNIEPGRYIFTVKAAKNKTLKEELKSSLEIIITPPIWSTLPFRLAMSFIILFILYGLYKLRTKSIMKRNKELSAINKELNDQIFQRMQLQRQLDQTQKLDSIGTLAGGIAHDFNNLLTVIMGYSDIALMKMKNKKDTVYKNILEVRQAAERAENLTNQILTFSRKQIYQPKITDINKIIADSNKMVQSLIGEDIRIEEKLTSDLPPVKADPVQIEQILINLFVNARDAINLKTQKASEKKITITTDQQYLDKTFTESHIESKIGQHIIITISDNGIGMSREVQDKIFEPFFTTKEKGKGTGLGLATVYGIVKQNGGNIYVYSEQDSGTTFKIFWPAAEGSAVTIHKKDPPNEILSGQESLLLVEDDKDVAKFAHSALSELGYKVKIAENGQQALEIINAQDNHTDLLITDLIMPVMNGKELSEKVQEINPEISVLFVSGYTEEHIVDKGELDKDINFLAKPYTVGALSKRIREILDRPIKN